MRRPSGEWPAMSYYPVSSSLSLQHRPLSHGVSSSEVSHRPRIPDSGTRLINHSFMVCSRAGSSNARTFYLVWPATMALCQEPRVGPGDLHLQQVSFFAYDCAPLTDQCVILPLASYAGHVHGLSRIHTTGLVALEVEINGGTRPGGRASDALRLAQSHRHRIRSVCLLFTSVSLT